MGARPYFPSDGRFTGAAKAGERSAFEPFENVPSLCDLLGLGPGDFFAELNTSPVLKTRLLAVLDGDRMMRDHRTGQPDVAHKGLNADGDEGRYETIALRAYMPMLRRWFGNMFRMAVSMTTAIGATITTAI